MKITMLQQNYWIGDFEGNMRKHLDGYREGCRQGADLVVSTELGIFGYPPKDMLERRYYLDKQDDAFRELCAHVGDVGFVVGIVGRNTSSNGRALYNQAVLVQNGYITQIRNKALLPNYDVYDEWRYFEPGRERAHSFMYKGKRIAMLVCEDIWRGMENTQGHRLYERDPVEELKSDPPEILVVINGSHYHLGKGAYRYDLVSGIAEELGCDVVYVNKISGDDDLIFDGRSFHVNGHGICLAAAPAFEEAITLVDTDSHGSAMYPMDRVGNTGDLRKALVLSIRDYARKQKVPFGGALVPLSGGADSALTAFLARDAFGSDNVEGIGLPCYPFSSEGSVIDARALAKNAGIKFQVGEITEVYNAVGRVLGPMIGWYEPESWQDGDTTQENVQPRIRCIVASAYTNRPRADEERLLWLATGNKSEILQGFWTLFGDTGMYAPLADVYKTQVFNLISLYPGIPVSTIKKPPSPELKLDQKDSDTLPPYHILDPILQRYVERRMSMREITMDGFDEETVRKVIDRVHGSEFKRIFMPYGPKVSEIAVGTGRRWPIAARF